MDGEILEVLKEIRDEAKATNARLESLEGRVEFLEKRTSKGLETLNQELQTYARQQAANDIRLSTEVVALADVNRDLRDLISRKLDDHKMVLQHEQRITALETRADGRNTQ